MDPETRRRKKTHGLLRAAAGLVLILFVLATLSLVGVTPDQATGLDDLVDKADEALYRAKHLGRNRVEAAR